MRPNTPREQLLQNLLAMSSVLLYRSTKALGADDISLVIEIETWFIESQEAIKHEIEQEYVVMPERRAEKRFSPTDQSPWIPAQVPMIREEDIPEVLIIAKKTSYFGV